MTSGTAPMAPVHRTIVAVDIDGFSRRTDPAQVAVREGLYRVLADAFRSADIAPSSYDVEDRGDGALVLIPPRVSKSLLLGRLPDRLAEALRDYNLGRAKPLRLRIAFHAGEVIQTDQGYVGSALLAPVRLADSAQLRTAHQLAGASLVVAVTDTFHREVVEASSGADPAKYRRVMVEFDGHSGPAWIYFPGPAPPTPPPRDPPVNSRLGSDDLHHRSIFIVDIAGSGSCRDDVKRLHRAKLREIVLGAIGDAEIEPDQYDPPTDTGDGLRVLFAPEVGKNRLVGPMVTALSTRLARYNTTVGQNARMRLRSVLSAGELRRDEYDYFGNALNEAYWLLDSQVLRECLTDSKSDTALMVTEAIYDGVVRHGYGDIDPDSYEPRTVSLKNRDVQTWVSWPDFWTHS